MAEGVPLIEAAALGDHASQTALRDEFLTQAGLAGKGVCHYAVPACDLMMSAETWARIAAFHPAATCFDHFILASVLLMRAGSHRQIGVEETYADCLEAEGRGLLNHVLATDGDFVASTAFVLQRLADAGDEWAATALAQLVESLPPEEAATVAADVAEVERHHDEQEA